MKRYLQKLFVRIQSSLEIKENYPNLESFEDPLALKIEWTPLKKGGANFVTHRLRLLSPAIVEFNVSWGYKAFSLLFLLSGMALLLWGGYDLFLNGKEEFRIVIFLVVGLGFSLSGGYLFRQATRRIIFDKDQGFFWKSRFGPKEVPNRDSIKVIKRLSDIHAIQVISEEVSSSEHNYESFEINLVMHSGDRINLVDHGGYGQIVVDSVLLAKFLSIPIWPYLRQGKESEDPFKSTKNSNQSAQNEQD